MEFGEWEQVVGCFEFSLVSRVGRGEQPYNNSKHCFRYLGCTSGVQLHKIHNLRLYRKPKRKARGAGKLAVLSAIHRDAAS
jgi:hypothetical protein